MRQIQGSGGGGCFPAGTLISTPIGPRRVEDIRIGDVVYATRISLEQGIAQLPGTVVEKRVTATFIHTFGEVGYTSPLLKVQHRLGTLNVTGNHYILTPSRQSTDAEPNFCRADELQPGDMLYTGKGEASAVVSIQRGADYDFVYNFEVDEVHTYTADGIWVHNGGGGGKDSGAPRVSVESPDSLRSRQYARVLDAVSEGEIVGLINGLKSVYLDDTPVQNADGTANFSGITLDTRNGTQNQTYIPGFPAVEAETAVGVEVRAGVSVVRSISNPNLNAIRVTVSIPALSEQNTSNGDVSGTSVSLSVDIQTNGGGYVNRITDTITGKTTSRYQRSYRIELSGTGPWDVRVNRITPNSLSQALQNRTFFDSYTEIIDARLTYPNTALVGLAVDAERFRSIPRRGFEMKGLLVRIPSNYNPVTRAYTGSWDGTFSIAWTDNPAWCFYDLLTTGRYGLGDYLNADQVDKWSLYQIGRYCDVLVSNGLGGLEPRFTCSLYLQSQDEAYNVISAMASVFCAITYWAGGAVVASQDSPSDAIALFNPSNTVANEEGLHFSYAGSSIRARHTVALVSWNDPADRYRQKIEYVEDISGVAQLGVIQTQVVAVGCTSRGQAHRFGRRILFSERLETEAVSFRVGLDAAAIAPGNVIKISDPVRAGVRFGGRLISATTLEVTLDAPVEIVLGKTYTLWTKLPDGTVEERTVTNSPGLSASLSVTPAFSAAPQTMAVWVLAASDLNPESWRIISIKELDETQAEVTAMAYFEDKYEAIENGLVLEPLNTSAVNPDSPTPTDLTVTESLYPITPVLVGTRLTVSWLGVATYFELQYRNVLGNWLALTTTSSSVDIQPVTEGTYEFVLVAVNSLGRRSPPRTATKIVYGKTLRPANVSNLNLSAIGGAAHITFDSSTDLDVLIGGHLRIRHTSLTTDPGWTNTVDIGPQIPGNSSNTVLPLLAGTYLAKWVDSNGNESLEAVSVSTTAPNVTAFNQTAELIEDPSFPGIKDGVYRTPGGDLVLDSIETIGQQLGNVSTWPLLSLLGGGVRSVGTYYFANGVDLESVQTSRVTARLSVGAFDALDLISSRPLVSSWESVLGGPITDVGCTIMIRTTDDDPTGSPTWTDWQPFVVGDYRCRAFEFSIVLYSNYLNHNIGISTLRVTVDMPDRFESGNDLVSGAGVYSVTYSLPFVIAPAVGITAQNLGEGDYYSITNKTVGGFDIEFFDTGVPVSRVFDYISKGY